MIYCSWLCSSRGVQLMHTFIFKKEMMDVKRFIDDHLPPIDWTDLWEAFYINTPASTVVEC